MHAQCEHIKKHLQTDIGLAGAVIFSLIPGKTCPKLKFGHTCQHFHIFMRENFVMSKVYRQLTYEPKKVHPKTFYVTFD